MKKVKLKGSGLVGSKLKAISDYYIIEEDPIELTQDNASGLTKDVTSALNSGLLVLPDIGEYFAKKYPFRGVIISRGDKTKFNLSIGTRVMFARMGGQRWQKDGKQFVTIREKDIHAIVD